MTPYEIQKGKRPNLSCLKIWGCDAYVKCIVYKKLKVKLDKSKFMGYL